jgi:hypothetical protein
MSKTLILFVGLVAVAAVFTLLTVRSFLEERTAARPALGPEPPPPAPPYPPAPPSPPRAS